MELHHPNATRVRLCWSLARLTVACVLIACAVASLSASDAGAGQPESRRGIEVVQVEGLLDPPNITLVLDAIQRANDDRLTMVVLQLDSGGAVSDVGGIVRAIGRSRVPVVAWVGPSGADATGAAALIVEAAHVAFVSQGSSLGPAEPLRLDDPDASRVGVVRARLEQLAEERGRDASGAGRLATSELGPREATDIGATNGVRAIVGEVIVKLDGTTVRTTEGDLELSTATVIGKGRDRRRQPNQDVIFDSLGIGAQLQHTLISPSIAYFLLVAGLALIVFEFFAASVGFAAAVGAISVVGAAYGFSHLPVHWWGIALLLLAAFGFAVDAQAGGLGFWTGVGAVALVSGSVTLYGGDAGLRPAWWVIVVVCGGTVLFYAFAMPAFIRSRFSTPTIGREGMIGELGTAEVPVDPDGVVLIRGARWRARTNRATPVAAGDAARVVAVDGLVLEVEPESGGAIDYRERARSRRKKE